MMGGKVKIPSCFLKSATPTFSKFWYADRPKYVDIALEFQGIFTANTNEDSFFGFGGS
jgi:hypothetical protein